MVWLRPDGDGDGAGRLGATARARSSACCATGGPADEVDWRGPAGVRRDGAAAPERRAERTRVFTLPEMDEPGAWQLAGQHGDADGLPRVVRRRAIEPGRRTRCSSCAFSERPAGVRTPLATYRLQLGPELGFDDVPALLPVPAGARHRRRLPVAGRSRPGRARRHGYDVIDPLRLSDALGGREALRPAVGRAAGARHGAAAGHRPEPHGRERREPVVARRPAARPGVALRAVLRHRLGGARPRRQAAPADARQAARAGRRRGELRLDAVDGEPVLALLRDGAAAAPGKRQLAVRRRAWRTAVNADAELLALADAQHYRLAFWREAASRGSTTAASSTSPTSPRCGPTTPRCSRRRTGWSSSSCARGPGDRPADRPRRRPARPAGLPRPPGARQRARLRGRREDPAALGAATPRAGRSRAPRATSSWTPPAGCRSTPAARGPLGRVRVALRRRRRALRVPRPGVQDAGPRRALPRPTSSGSAAGSSGSPAADPRRRRAAGRGAAPGARRGHGRAPGLPHLRARPRAVGRRTPPRSARRSARAEARVPSQAQPALRFLRRVLLLEDAAGLPEHQARERLELVLPGSS